MKKKISDSNPFAHIIHPTLSLSDCIERGYSPKTGNGNSNLVKQDSGAIAYSSNDISLNYKKFLDDCMTKSSCEGKVVGYNEHGLFVEIYGIMAFMPQSQIDVSPQTNFETYVNQAITFNLICLKTKNIGLKSSPIIISHRNVVKEAISKQEPKGFSEGEIVNAQIVGDRTNVKLLELEGIKQA